MRLIRLLGVAMQAEGLRLRSQIRRIVIRLVLCYGVLILVFCAATFGHIAGWYWLCEQLSPVQAALVLTAVDLLLALILALVVARMTPGQVEREARSLREQALLERVEAVSLSALVVQLITRLMTSRGKD